MHHIILSIVVFLVLVYISTLSFKWYDFRKNVPEHKMWVLIPTSLSEMFLVLRKIQRNIVIHVHRSASIAPTILVRFSCNVNFCGQIFERPKNIKFHGNPSNGSRVASHGQTDRQRDMTKLTFAFRSFANTPKTTSRLKNTGKFPTLPNTLELGQNTTFRRRSNFPKCRRSTGLQIGW